jgi:hypothetical protein
MPVHLKSSLRNSDVYKKKNRTPFLGFEKRVVTVTNIKLKGAMNGFFLYSITQSFYILFLLIPAVLCLCVIDILYCVNVDNYLTSFFYCA